MLKFFKKHKKIDTAWLKNFNNILKVIGDFIIFEEFEKASKAIDEVLHKENDSFKYYIDNVAEKEKNEEIKKFKEKLKKIEKLKDLNDEKKKKYQIKTKQKKQKEELKNLNKQVVEYIQNWSFEEAIFFVNSYIEKNPSDIKILNLWSDLKKLITKELNKYKEKKQKEIKKDTLKEAQELIWEIITSKEGKNKNKNTNLITNLKEKFNFYVNFKKRYKEKKLLDEVNLLIQSKKEKDILSAQAKLAQVHSWVSREITNEKINWYDIYGKILWADKVTWDSLSFSKNKNEYNFFIWDATWHGIKAWFIISQINKLFQDLSKKLKLENLTMEINNSLKQDLKSGNFITSIFFNIDESSKNKVNFIWMWHEPIFVYRNDTKKVEKIIPWGLAAWIRIIKDLNTIKRKEIILNDQDILVTYTDWIVETKNPNWEMYSIDRIWKKLEEFWRYLKSSPQEIYDKYIEDLKNFAWWNSNYNDDVTILILKRDKNKDILKKDSDLEWIILKENIDKKYKKKFTWKTIEEIREEILRAQKEQALKNILKSLEIFYTTWELPKLKTECVRYIKEWYIHKKINFYLKKALDNESMFKQKQKNQKIRDKYEILKDLYKKWDYENVIIECSSIISKNWNI